MAKRKMILTPPDNIAKQIMETYQPQDAQEIQDVVKRIFAPIFEAALKGEMQNHLGYAPTMNARIPVAILATDTPKDSQDDLGRSPHPHAP
ncbi:hypothetical protein [uncultured Selenomonas sp.]|uniref:hypothetical protein n=1 Tax=uncultured Selenomonas sp. TaxID=159275 RepID=UPI0028D3753E|nr:hypothetical protein [uncultured Selenomonas sp.]